METNMTDQQKQDKDLEEVTGVATSFQSPWLTDFLQTHVCACVYKCVYAFTCDHTATCLSEGCMSMLHYPLSACLSTHTSQQFSEGGGFMACPYCSGAFQIGGPGWWTTSNTCFSYEYLNGLRRRNGYVRRNNPPSVLRTKPHSTESKIKSCGQCFANVSAVNPRLASRARENTSLRPWRFL